MRRLRFAPLITLVMLLPGSGAVAAEPAPASAAIQQHRALTMSVFLPNVTKTLGGPDGWQTPFIVQNVGATDTELRIEIRPFGSQQLIAERTVPQLAPGTSYALVPNLMSDLPDNSQFSVTVRSYGSKIVAVVNQHQGVGVRAEALSYNGLSSGARTVRVPYVAKNANGWLTTLIIQNVTDFQAGQITATFVRLDGGPGATITRMLFPLQTTFIDPTIESALASGSEYSVTLSSDLAPIAVVANSHNDAPSVAAPRGLSYNGTQPGGRSYLPYVTRNVAGATTRIVVQNGGLEASTPTLTIRAIGGSGVATVTAPAPIAPGRAWSYDPRFAADGTTPCVAGPTCPADGEHSVVVSGGAFATVAMDLGAATAMGYTGSAATSTRVYLPNVTRTLGGATGWTTPLVIQSAGATSATLRWFRFTDGALVRSQELTGLTAGGSARVDPRSVSGLSDDTQYSVVVDANGPVYALVTELQQQGGDGAMIYDGVTFATGPTIEDQLASCPSAADVASVRADFVLTFDVDPTAGTLVCRAASGSADLTLMQRRIYQTILTMRRLSFSDPLPWTSKTLYQWFVDAIDGIRFADVPLSYCCEPANTIVIRTTSNMYHVLTDRWTTTEDLYRGGLRDTMVLFIHEARHNEGKPHTCGASDNTISEMGAWGVQYSIFRWLAERADPLFVVPSEQLPPSAGTSPYPTFFRDGSRTAAEDTRTVRFCQPG